MLRVGDAETGFVRRNQWVVAPEEEGGGERERERETEGAVVKLRWNVIVAGFFERRATGQKDENVTAPKFHKDGWLARERREEWLQSMQRRWKRV